MITHGNEIKLFEEWTELSMKDLLFDSEIDNWSINTSEFDKKIFGTTPSSFNDSYDTVFCYRKGLLIKNIIGLLSDDRKQAYTDFFGVNNPKDAV